MKKSDGILYLLIALALAAVLLLATSGCTPTSDDYRYLERIEVVEESTNILILRDRETGVLYMAIYNRGTTPLYNADGTLCTEG